MTQPTPPTALALPPPDALAPVAASPEALVLPGGWQIEGLPATIRRAGPQAAEGYRNRPRPPAFPSVAPSFVNRH